MTGQFSCVTFVLLFIFYWSSYVLYYVVAWTTGLDMCGIHVPEIQENVKNFMDEANVSARFINFGNCSNNTFIWNNKPRMTWGLLTIGTTFIPGILFSISNLYSFIMGSRTRLCKHLFSGNMPRGLFTTLMISVGLILFYPVYISFLIGCCLIYQSEKSFKNVQTIISLESFLVCAPQILIQFHIVCSGGFPTTLTIIFFLQNIIRFSKAALEFHIGPDTFRDMGFGQKCFSTIKLLPLFGTCIVFRMGSLLMLFTHVNSWAFLSVFAMCLLVGIIARKAKYTILQSILAGPVNMCTLVPNINIFTGGQEQQERGVVSEREDPVTTDNNTEIFYRKSSLVVFFVYTISMLIFISLWTIHNLGFIDKDTDWFEMSWWNKKIFYFYCGQKDIINGFVFYITCGTIILCGFLNLMFVFWCGNNRINPVSKWVDISSIISDSVDDESPPIEETSNPGLMGELSAAQNRRKNLLKSIRKTIRRTGNKQLINFYTSPQESTANQEDYTTLPNPPSPSVRSPHMESSFSSASSRGTYQRSGYSVSSSADNSSRGTNQGYVASSVSTSSRETNQRSVAFYTMGSITSDEENRGSI